MKKKQWEYKVAMFAINDFLPKNLEVLGNEGWEIVNVFPIEEIMECNKYYRYFFKREKVKETEENEDQD